jgi:DNA polymerase-3 subunit epsilon
VIVFVDTETTGLDPLAHELLDAHALLCTPDLVIVEEAGGRILPERPEEIEPAAAAVNGYTPELWAASARESWYVLPDLLNVIAKADTWIGSNPWFDFDFLARAAGDRLGLIAPHNLKMVCTAGMARQKRLPGRHGLDALCTRFGIVIDGAHTARGDCLRALEVYRELMR